jgi:outer membrane usher protein
VSGISDEGTLVAKWGSEADQTCEITYRLPPSSEDRGAYAHATGVCGDVAVASNGAGKQASVQKPVVEAEPAVSGGDVQSSNSAPHVAPATNAMPVAATQGEKPVAAESAVATPVAPATTYKPVASSVGSKPFAVSTQVVKRASIWDDWQPRPAISTGDGPPAADTKRDITTGNAATVVVITHDMSLAASFGTRYRLIDGALMREPSNHGHIEVEPLHA